LTLAVYIAVYAGAAVFLAGSIGRVIQCARTPVHLRWELYPIPHEKADQARHGGSYFEENDWWERPQERRLRGQWAAMLQEIFLLRALRESNPRLWAASLLFHAGLYLSIAAAGVAAVSGLAGLAISGAEWAGHLRALAPVSSGMGLAGAALMVAGACWLLVKRVGDPALKNYTKPADIFNLAWFVFAFALMAIGYAMPGTGTASAAEVVRGAFHFDLALRIGTAYGAGLILASMLAAYIPFTHMAHFIAKYFTWHSVRWDDRRNEPGGAVERGAAVYLNCKPAWSAPHVGANGKRDWAEIAAMNPVEEAKK
jgi:nitrate reductase gamma subunit